MSSPKHTDPKRGYRCELVDSSGKLVTTRTVIADNEEAAGTEALKGVYLNDVAKVRVSAIATVAEPQRHTDYQLYPPASNGGKGWAVTIGGNHIDKVFDNKSEAEQFAKSITQQPAPAPAAPQPDAYHVDRSNQATWKEPAPVAAEPEPAKAARQRATELHEAFAQASAELERVKQLNSELLAALKGVLASKQVRTILNHARAERDLYAAYKAARVVIASADGGAS